MNSNNFSIAKSLVSRFGTPIYVYDLAAVDERLGELRSFLPEGSTLFYSLKANPLPAIAASLSGRGVSAEVSSQGELEVALSASSPESILYTGPGKTPDEIKLALASGVTLFSCESLEDFRRVARVSREMRTRARVLLRINPAKSPAAGLAMSGVPSQFGIEEEDVPLFSREMADARDHLDVLGFHFYYGTQVATADSLERSFSSSIEIARRLTATVGVDLRLLDLGGGFSWPFAKRGANDELLRLKSSVHTFMESNGLDGVHTCFESGRYLCASSGMLLTTVLDVKTSKGKKFVLTDAGINALGGMSGLGRLIPPQLDIEPISTSSEGPDEQVSIVGPLCSPLDFLARNAAAPPLRPGDVIGVPNVGAYGLTASLSNFLSRPAPLEIVHREGRVLDVYRLRGGHSRAHAAGEYAHS